MSTTYFLRPALSQMVPEAFIHLERLIIGMEKMNRGWHTHTKHSLSGLLGKGSKSAGRQLCPFTSLHVAIFFFLHRCSHLRHRRLHHRQYHHPFCR